MRQRYFSPGAGKLTFLLDTFAVLASLFLALAIRSQFEAYWFTLPAGVAVFSLTIVLRMLSMFIFDAYTMSSRTVTVADMQKIMAINLVPSLVLLVLRLVSPTPTLRMPYSIIILEYFATTFGFILIRTIMHNFLARRSTTVGYRRRILLWAEISDVKRLIPDVRATCESQRLDVRGIFNANPLFWQSEYEGIRVFGDESSIRDLLFADDRISAVYFLTPYELTLRQLDALEALCGELNMEAGVMRDGAFTVVRFEEVRSLASAKHDTAVVSL